MLLGGCLQPNSGSSVTERNNRSPLTIVCIICFALYLLFICFCFIVSIFVFSFRTSQIYLSPAVCMLPDEPSVINGQWLGELSLRRLARPPAPARKERSSAF